MSLFDSSEKVALNFSISRKSDLRNSAMSSNVISETSLEEDHILLKRKSLLKRKFLSSEKIYYREILDLKLEKSSYSSLYSTISITYSKNGYSKRFLYLSSSDGFAVRWFFDELVVRYSYIKSNLDKSYDFSSNESDWMENNDGEDDLKSFDSLDDSDSNSENSNLNNSLDDSDSNNMDDSNSNKSSQDSNYSKQSKLSDFVSAMNKELSEDEARKLKKKLQFDRCSSEER